MIAYLGLSYSLALRLTLFSAFLCSPFDHFLFCRIDSKLSTLRECVAVIESSNWPVLACFD
jgi:hypothetical protein